MEIEQNMNRGSVESPEVGRKPTAPNYFKFEQTRQFGHAIMKAAKRRKARLRDMYRSRMAAFNRRKREKSDIERQQHENRYDKLGAHIRTKESDLG